MSPLTALPTEKAIPASDVAGVTLEGVPVAVPVAAPVAALLAEAEDETTAVALEATLEALTEAADVPADLKLVRTKRMSTKMPLGLDHSYRRLGNPRE
jgi:hypothetical protein